MSEERNVVVGFKVTQKEYDQMKRVAKICFDREKLQSDSVGALARALAFVKINEWLAIEQLQKELDERERVQQVARPA